MTKEVPPRNFGRTFRRRGKGEAGFTPIRHLTRHSTAKKAADFVGLRFAVPRLLGGEKMLLFVTHSTSPLLRLPAVTFRRDHPLLLRPAFFAGLTSDKLQRRSSRGFSRARPLFQFRAEFAPGQLAISRLRPLLLNTHFQPGGTVPQTYGRGGLVDFLASGPGTAHKSLFDITRQYAQRIESSLSLRR